MATTKQRAGGSNVARAAVGKPAAPGHVAIIGLGPSSEQYANVTKRLGDRRAFCDETWGINSIGAVYQCDRVFHMDDVRIQAIRAEAAPDSNIAAMLRWLKTYPGPVYTSRTHPDYPGLVAYPLEDVINASPISYFNSTAAYAVAFAVYLGVRKVTCFGMDFTYPNAHDAEKGRACVEMWLGIAAARGIKISMPRESSLMDACYSLAERTYGYDTLDVSITTGADGKHRVGFKERDELPTAAAIEAAYDHSKHPNPLVKE